jgi:hypothetical protein
MAFTWTDATITAGTTEVRAVHLTDLRTNYKSVEGSVTFSPAVSATFTDTITAASSNPRAVYITELRAAVNNLETNFSGNCNCNNCCQTCQSCQGAESCQTCQGTESCQTCQT